MGKLTGEEQGGRWQPGESGNPKGRPKGSRNRLTRACADLLAADSEKIMAKLIKEAKAGHDVALKLCVERLLPARAARDRWVTVDVPTIEHASDLVAASAAVIERAAAGEISLSEAKEFMMLVDAQRRAIETADLAMRIEALEAPEPLPAGIRITGVGAEDPDRRATLARLRRTIEEHVGKGPA